MDSTDLLEEMSEVLAEAENGPSEAQDRSAILICKTLLVCTQALCHEMSALREVAEGISADLSNIDYKIPEQS